MCSAPLQPMPKCVVQQEMQALPLLLALAVTLNFSQDLNPKDSSRFDFVLLLWPASLCVLIAMETISMHV